MTTTLTILSDELQSIITESITHAARMAGSEIEYAASRYTLPSVLYRPALSIEGNQWCALYGENLQDGVAGFGDSPAAAMADFDANWSKTL